MQHLTVGGVTYDTVGEASVTQVVSSGTKIATVTIDGTNTDLYAPSGGSTIDPATATPLVDGTAAVGTSAKYAREDHVHPTDTSRAASTHAHGNITSGGDITATAPTIASGDKLIINDESASKVTNGPAFGTSTSTFLRNDGTWAEPSSSGGVSYYTTTATLPTSGWSSDSITVNVANMTASADVIVAPAPASASAYAAAGIVCTAQGSGTLTFTRTSANTAAITVNVMVFEGGSEVVLYSINNTASSLFSVDKSEALVGEIITITRIGSQSNVYIVNDTTLEVTPQAIKVSGGSTTFSMPASSVTIRGTAS